MILYVRIPIPITERLPVVRGGAVSGTEVREPAAGVVGRVTNLMDAGADLLVVTLELDDDALRARLREPRRPF